MTTGGRTNILAADLDRILEQTEALWQELRGERLFITGGTGFFGLWLLESFCWANERLGLNASAVMLTRDADAFRRSSPHLANNGALTCQAGDVRTFAFPEGSFSHIIHAAATTALATFQREDPLIKFDTLVAGTRRTLDFAAQCQARKLLFTSSGVVYGPQPSDMTHIPEDYQGGPDPTDATAVWGESKRASELLCALYARRFGLQTKIARCFSFVGPHLPIDIHYAIGNFVRDAIAGGPIRIHGDGKAHRSYLYASDLTVWLWTILFKGEACRAYNVGSDAGVSIAELASIVATAAGGSVDVTISGSSPEETAAGNRYIPSTQRAAQELGLRQTVSLPEAIERMIDYVKTMSKVRPT